MENFKERDATAWIACPVPHGPRAFASIVTGESMKNPSGGMSFSDGDYIFCDPDKSPKNNSPVIAQMPAADSPVFRNLIIEGQRRYLQALNPSWPDRIVEMPPGSEILGTVIFRGEIV